MKNPTATKARKELELLDRARKEEFLSGAHYNTVCAGLERVGFPYKLVQTDRNDLGEFSRHYRYYWRSNWDDDSALYINETTAGRCPASSVKKAIERIRKVLEEAAA